MNFIKRIFMLILCVVMLAVMCLSVSAKTVFPTDDWVLEHIENETQFEIDVYNGTQSEVTTIATYMNLPVTSIGSYAFLDNTTLTSITFSDNIQSVQTNAFVGLAQLETVTFDKNLKFIDTNAFLNCTSLTAVDLANTQLTTVSEGAFKNCESVTEVTLPKTLVDVKSQAFAQCDSLNKVYVPMSVTDIASDAFLDSKNVVIYCHENTYAHNFAIENGFEYELVFDSALSYYLGDLDNDCAITVLDATDIQLYSAERKTLDDNMILRGNVDCDSFLTVIDATYIQLYIADKPDANVCVGQVFHY